MAKLVFRYGAMNCGKSTALIQVAHNYEERDNKAIVIKPGIDTKGGDTVVSRVGIDRKVDYLIGEDESILDKIKGEIDNLDCILTDESQFFTKRQIRELYFITKVFDIPVLCYGLRTDFKRELFPGSEELLALADEFDELITICRCGKKARFNARKVNGVFVSDGDQIAIDMTGDVTYESVCGKCYYEKVLHLDLENEKSKIMEKTL